MTVAMSGVLAAVIMVGMAVAAIGALYAAKTRAQSAADAAALAAAVATYPPASGQMPVPSAREIAAANGATLTACDCVVDTSMTSRVVLVSVVVDAEVPVFGTIQVRSSSRAEFDPGRWLGR